MTVDRYHQDLIARHAAGLISRRDLIRLAMTTGIGLSGATLLAGRAMAQTPQKGGFLRAGLGHGATTDTLDPGTLEAGFLIPLASAINGYLTGFDARSAVEAGLAESWEATPDAKSWTFTLRRDATFHDGRPVTAEDVIASINYHRGEASTSAAKPLVAKVVDIRSPGAGVIEFELDSGNADFPAALADYHFAILPADGDTIDWRSGVGSGPYVLENFEPGVSAELRRYDGFWSDAVGHLNEWRLLSLIDGNARTTALISGNVDVIDKVDPSTAALLGRNPAVAVHTVAGNQHYTFPMRTDVAPFEDNTVRQAIKWAIDRESLVERVLFGYGSVGNDHPIGRGQQFYNDQMEQKAFDPDRARGLLRDAGLDGLNVQLHTSEGAFSGAIDAAVLIKDSCAQAGIDVEVVREPSDGYWSNVWRNKPWCASYFAGRPVEDLMLSLAYPTGVSWNESFWSNERFDTLLAEARAELDADRRREMYYELQDIVANQGGVAIPMFANYIFASRDNVGHPETFGANQDMDGARFVERWWAAG